MSERFQYGFAETVIEVSEPETQRRFDLPIPPDLDRVDGLLAWAEPGPNYQAAQNNVNWPTVRAGHLFLGSHQSKGYFHQQPVDLLLNWDQYAGEADITDLMFPGSYDFARMGTRIEFVTIHPDHPPRELFGYYRDAMLKATGISETYQIYIALRYHKKP